VVDYDWAEEASKVYYPAEWKLKTSSGLMKPEERLRMVMIGN